ncbi:hypothetical protein Q4S45_10235 [Massilia sp. R2A-15]|uniref:hypothetical protein n=1 Tax=Massilia sp. R2A-15 TaxID=3064278 RepID=UPI00273427DB|nr:hypothetical protein [Massilia sp. R2A-15]WLI91473.1 hypothetical protein Q4S45_10235 [Massilia sp. R2A-15]
MKRFSPVAALRQFRVRAAIPVAMILAGHWYRNRQLNRTDLLIAAVVFLSCLIVASRLASRTAEKV